MRWFDGGNPSTGAVVETLRIVSAGSYAMNVTVVQMMALAESLRRASLVLGAAG
jgi:hypothetical protein